LGIITDGRSVTQRNKLTQTGMLYFFDDILISEEFGSEKPNNANYMYYHKYGEANYFYIGDNLGKDFLAPNALNWTTICLLDNGNNIHKQDFNLDSSFLPKYKINNLDEVLKFIN
jgi:putative hydrolase of the HAD superfamily